MSTDTDRPPRILLVEDEAIIALSEKQMIERHGFAVVTVHSGEDAVRTACDDSEIRLVLMDIDLGGGIDGTEAAERILRNRHLPIVFLTSHTEKEYVERVRAITGYGYVIKSAGEFVLVESIRMALKLFEANERARREERTSRLERDRFDALSRMSPTPIVLTDRFGMLRFANEEAKNTLGISESEVPRRSYDAGEWEITHFDGSPFPGEELPFARVSRTHESVYDVRHAITKPDGSRRYLSINATPVFDEDGEFDGIIAVTRDMTEQFKHEAELAESEARYREIFNNAPVGVFQTDSRGRALSVNATMAHMVGAATPQEAIEHFHDLAHQLYVDEERRAEFLRRLRAHGRVENFEYEARTLTGAHRYFSMSARMHSILPDGSFIIDGFTADITDKRAAELTAEEREESLRATLQSIGDGLITTDLDGTITRMNPVAEQLTGVSFADAEGRPVTSVLRLVDEAEEMPMEDPVGQVLRSGEPANLPPNAMLLSRSGGRLRLGDSIAPIRNTQGAVTGAVIVFRKVEEGRILGGAE
jgi:PAS domain S-box-containing protein